jgi:hypothetical protein
MRDWRDLDGGLFNTPLLEIRALSKELVYLERMGYTEISEMKYRTLEPYIQILLGSISVEDTHVYRASMHWLVNGIKLLPDDKKCKLKSAIEGSIGR